MRVEDGWMYYAGGCDGGGADGLTGLPESPPPPLQKPGRQAAQSLLLVSATAPEDNFWASRAGNRRRRANRKGYQSR